MPQNKISVKFNRLNPKSIDLQKILCTVRTGGGRASLIVDDLEVSQQDWIDCFCEGDFANAFIQLQSRQMMRSIGDGICKLKTIAEELIEIHKELGSNSTPKRVVNQFKVNRKGVKTLQIEDDSFADFARKFIDRASKFPSPKTGKVVSSYRIGNFKKFKELLECYCETVAIPANFRNFDSQLIDDFTVWLSEDQEYHHNTIHKYIKVLFQMFESAYTSGTYPAWKRVKGRLHRLQALETLNIALRPNELDALSKLNLDDAITIAVRDWFLIGCYTACRFSDLMRLHRDMINDGFIYYSQQKSGGVRKVCLPIEDELQPILDRYAHTPTGFPRIVFSRTFNQRIQEICAMIPAMNEVAEVNVKAGLGRTKIIESKRFLEVSSHTMRRTYATRLHQAGVSADHIIVATGHARVSSLMNYIKLSNRGRAEVLKNRIEETKQRKTVLPGVIQQGNRIIVNLKQTGIDAEVLVDLLRNQLSSQSVD